MGVRGLGDLHWEPPPSSPQRHCVDYIPPSPFSSHLQTFSHPSFQLMPCLLFPRENTYSKGRPPAAPIPQQPGCTSARFSTPPPIRIQCLCPVSTAPENIPSHPPKEFPPLTFWLPASLLCPLTCSHGSHLGEKSFLGLLLSLSTTHFLAPFIRKFLKGLSVLWLSQFLFLHSP